ncbi:MAG: sigma 54-interacting transcriptional regulator, partial [Candidatus Poribacteria bacterium]
MARADSWWVGGDGGAGMFDGDAWSFLDTRDGLSDNDVYAIVEDDHGDAWIGGKRGLTRYRRQTRKPTVAIVAVSNGADPQDADTDVRLVQGTPVTVEYASDAVEEGARGTYRTMLSGRDDDWEIVGSATRMNYADLPCGEYEFSVQAVDRDLNYSAPASIVVTVHEDARDVQIAAMRDEVERLRNAARSNYQFENIVGSSTAIQQVYALMEKAIESGMTVLVSGKTGTGKELVANGIHYNGPRADGPLVEVNCA